MSFESLRHRLETGRPLVVDADPGASFRARGVQLDVPGTLGQLLREWPDAVLSHYRAEVSSRVDVLSALTLDTTPRALAEVGMQHRSAALTNRAVELAREAIDESGRSVAIAGLLGSDMLGPMAAGRLLEELTEHAARLRVAGVELILARGALASIVAAARTGLPTWAVVECGEDDDGPRATGVDALGALSEAGATLVLFEVPSAGVGLQKLDQARSILRDLKLPAGVLVAASESALRGFDEPTSEPAIWAEGAVGLPSAGARVLGGGAGTTEAHTRALARAMGWLHPSVPITRSEPDLSPGSRGW